MNLHVKDEPALAVAVVQATIAVVISFGLELTSEQVGAIVALTAAVSALFLRRRVTPVEARPNTVPNADETRPADA